MDEELRLSLAKRLGLAEDATEEQIRTKLSEPVEEDPPPDGGDDEGDEGDGDGEEEGAGDPTATVTLDRAAYDELKAGAALARKHEKERTEDRVKETIEAAVLDGRIPPARREHWTKALTADFEGNKAVIDGLEKGLVPLDARGSGGPGGEGDGMDQPDGEGLPESWFPEIKTIRAQADSGQRVVHAKEG